MVNDDGHRPSDRTPDLLALGALPKLPMIG